MPYEQLMQQLSYDEVMDTLVGSLLLLAIVGWAIGFVCLMHWVIFAPLASIDRRGLWLLGDRHHEAERNDQHTDQQHND